MTQNEHNTFVNHQDIKYSASSCSMHGSFCKSMPGCCQLAVNLQFMTKQMSPFHATLKLTQTIFEYLEKIQIEIFFEFVSRYN